MVWAKPGVSGWIESWTACAASGTTNTANHLANSAATDALSGTTGYTTATCLIGSARPTMTGHSVCWIGWIHLAWRQTSSGRQIWEVHRTPVCAESCSEKIWNWRALPRATATKQGEEPMQIKELPIDANREPSEDCHHEWGPTQLSTVKVIGVNNLRVLVMRRCRKCWGWDIS